MAKSLVGHDGSMRTTLALALLMLVAAGGDAASSKQHEQTAGPAVPWVASRPSQVAERAPASQRCRAADLRIRSQIRLVPRLQGGIALISVWNEGKDACRLTGRPRVRILKSSGPKQAQHPIPPNGSNFPEVRYPESALLALRPGEAAGLTITWDNWCDLIVKGERAVPPRAIRFTLPGGGHLDADYNAVPPCIDPKAPTSIGVSRFQPSLIPSSGRPWSEAFLKAAVPGQPVHARRGGTLRFRVVLTNVSRTAATFDRCPAYIVQLVPRGTVQAYRLNCAAAHRIAPGKKLALAMRVRVPASSPTGPNGLFWELDPFGLHAPQLHARVTIDG
jgi:hypothetical protein